MIKTLMFIRCLLFGLGASPTRKQKRAIAEWSPVNDHGGYNSESV